MGQAMPSIRTIPLATGNLRTRQHVPNNAWPPKPLSWGQPLQDVFTCHPKGPAFGSKAKPVDVSWECRQRLVSPEALVTLIEGAKSPHVGKLPHKLIGKTPATIAWLQLDKLASVLRTLDNDPLPAFQFSVDPKRTESQTITCEFVAKGKLGGKTYRLTTPQDSFLFKVFFFPENVAMHGAWGEIAAGQFLSQWAIKDCSRFYAGNPKAGWLLDEWISPEEDPNQRGGPWLKDVMKRFNLQLHDDEGLNRSPRKILWDKGGICYAASPGGTDSDAKEASTSSDEGINAPKPLPKPQELPEKEQVALFENGLKLPATRLETIRRLGDYSPELRFELFKKALPHPDITAWAAHLIHRLPEEQRKEAYEHALTHYPATHQKASHMIWYLKPEDKPGAVQLALRYPASKLNVVGGIGYTGVDETLSEQINRQLPALLQDILTEQGFNARVKPLVTTPESIGS